MNRFWKWLAFAALPMVFAAAIAVAYLYEVPEEKTVRTKRYTREMGEGIVVNRSGLPGVDLVRLGSCRIEKRRMGVLTLGGFNTLVLEDLRIVLPERAEPTVSTGDADSSDSPEELLAHLGVDAVEVAGVDRRTRFSDLKIRGLQVAELHGTNVVEVFSAVSGRICAGGLRLSGCKVHVDGVETEVSDAVLKHRPRLRLEYAGGFRDM